MFKALKNSTGQSHAVEYVILFFMVAALIGMMSTYVRRGIQGRIHDARWFMGKTVSDVYPNRFTTAYEPYYANADVLRHYSSRQTRDYLPSGVGTSGIYNFIDGQSSLSQSRTMQDSPRSAP